MPNPNNTKSGKFNRLVSSNQIDKTRAQKISNQQRPNYKHNKYQFPGF